MAKKKKRSKPSPAPARPRRFSPGDPATPRRFAEDMGKVTELFDKKRWQEALEILLPLNRRYPHQYHVLAYLSNIYYELDDMNNYQRILQEMIELEPDDPLLWKDLADTYLLTLYPVLALQTYRQYLQRWPDHEDAASVRELLEKIEPETRRILGEVKVPDDADGLALAAKLDQLRNYLAQGDTGKARQAAQVLLATYPHFAPAHNNLSLAHWMEGNLEAAIQAARQVLAYEPDNVHALSNLIHFLYLLGRVNEARAYAETLRASPAPAADKHLKQIEGFIFLEDYPAVLALFEQARAEGELDSPPVNPMYFHLAAVAAWRQGDEEGAQRLWQQALKLQPAFALAQENLADSKRPVGERNGVWEFPFSNWISQQAMLDIERMIRPAVQGGNHRAAKNALHRCLQQYPELRFLTSVLLKRGDPAGRELVLMLAQLAETPDMSAMVRDFALSSYGPDAMRMKAMSWLSEHGEISSGTHRMYIQGEWRDDLLFLGFQIGDESEYPDPLPPRAEKLAEQAILALRENDWRKAQPLLEQALTLAPDSPGLLNNMATAYQMQGRVEEAYAMVHDIHARFPNYLFARTALARIAMGDGNLARAHELLDPLLQRRKLHFSEFGQMMGAFIDLYIAEDKKGAAKQWLQMWEQIDPQNPRIAGYKLQLGMSDFKQFFGLGRRK
ncbi:MAG TPA: tetratricopeptide repeat protein [Anaerolineae bacterium]|nr:tetratricopeptide repeat protein [Anaerolineae bacterium]